MKAETTLFRVRYEADQAQDRLDFLTTQDFDWKEVIRSWDLTCCDAYNRTRSMERNGRKFAAWNLPHWKGSVPKMPKTRRIKRVKRIDITRYVVRVVVIKKVRVYRRIQGTLDQSYRPGCEAASHRPRGICLRSCS